MDDEPAGAMTVTDRNHDRRPRPEWGEARSKTVRWFDPAATVAAGAGRSGLEFMRALADGSIPPPPIALLLDMWLTSVAVGRVVFECRPDESVYNPIGVIHGGLVCTLADSVAGCAVQTTLEPGYGFTSIDITVNYLRPVTLASGLLVATGEVTKPGRRVALATAEVVDGSGKTVASATSNCLVIPPA
jgi:uncharacterized protein (TIGR00369 family)